MKKPVNIAAIVPYKVYPAKMGGQKGIALFYEYLSELLPVNIITASGQQPERFKGNFFTVLGSSKLRYINPFLAARIKKIILRQKCSHLIIEHPYYGWLGVYLKRRCRMPLIVHSHNIESLRFRSTGKWWWKILWQYERFTHRNADANFFITDEDRQYAIKNFGLHPEKCHTITYGIESATIPSREEKQNARKRIEQLYHISPEETILFFNGTLSYGPNLDAVTVILDHINPILRTGSLRYKIIICGRSLPAGYSGLKERGDEHIIYPGFVDNISDYFKAADIFINPVIGGGGIKTKLVEALGYNVNGISTESGAIGITTTIAGEKLSVVPDNDWKGFASAILHADLKRDTPMNFFQHFYWASIAKKAAQVIESLA